MGYVNSLEGIHVVVVVVVVPFRFLAFGSSSLRGDGSSNYVDTVQCTGSGTLPTQPVPGPFLDKAGQFQTKFSTKFNKSSPVNS